MQPHVTFLSFAAVLLLAILVAIPCVAIILTPQRQFEGWNAVRPSIWHWLAFVGALAFSALIGYAWLFEGTKRDDAASQMQAALLLCVFFGGCAADMAYRIYMIRRRNLRVRGNDLIFEIGSGRSKSLNCEFVEAGRQTWTGSFEFMFSDGTIISIDPYARNGRNVVNQLTDELFFDQI